MSRKKKEPDLFGKERQVLHQIEEVIARGSTQDLSRIWNAYLFLSQQYESLLKVSIKLTNVSDTTQRKLIHAKEEIDLRTQELAQKNEALYRTSVTDHLTGLFNRMYLLDVLHREFALNRRQGQPLACAIMDIDKFKEFNDRYGHVTGDLVLRETAALIQGLLRKQDVFGRYGGEEFLLILPGTTLANAKMVAEKIRAKVAEAVLSHEGQQLKVTLSFGVADMVLGFPQSTDELIRNADLALYAAKRNGRNRVVLFSETL